MPCVTLMFRYTIYAHTFYMFWVSSTAILPVPYPKLHGRHSICYPHCNVPPNHHRPFYEHDSSAYLLPSTVMDSVVLFECEEEVNHFINLSRNPVNCDGQNSTQSIAKMGEMRIGFFSSYYFFPSTRWI